MTSRRANSLGNIMFVPLTQEEDGINEHDINSVCPVNISLSVVHLFANPS